MEEIWKDIKGFENAYQVSTSGRIRTKTREINSGKCSIRILESMPLKPLKGNCKYYLVGLYKKSKIKRLLVHRLVYENFIGEVPRGKTIDHIDNDPLNNRLDNLQLLTNRDNVSKYYAGIKKSSRFIGVSKHKPSGRWMAYIRNNIKKVYLGCFGTETEAGLAYQKAKIKFGLF